MQAFVSQTIYTAIPTPCDVSTLLLSPNPLLLPSCWMLEFITRGLKHGPYFIKPTWTSVPFPALICLKGPMDGHIPCNLDWVDGTYIFHRIWAESSPDLHLHTAIRNSSCNGGGVRQVFVYFQVKVHAPALCLL